MMQHIPDQSERHRTNSRSRANNYILPALWGFWTLIVVATACYSWRADMIAQRPLDLIGLTIHCMVVGIIALIGLTLVEMRLLPWRFSD